MHVECTSRRSNVHGYALGQDQRVRLLGLPSANRPRPAGPLSFDRNFECKKRVVLLGSYKFMLITAAIKLAFHTHGCNELALFFCSRVVWSKCNPNRFRDIQRFVPPGEINGESAHGVPQRV
jgi:hypothetical protein